MADARDRQRHFLRDAGWLPLALAAKRCLPPWGTFYHWFAKFRDDGLLEKINHSLVMADRERVGREASPSGASIDSQSVKTTEAGVLHEATICGVNGAAKGFLPIRCATCRCGHRTEAHASGLPAY